MVKFYNKLHHKVLPSKARILHFRLKLSGVKRKASGVSIQYLILIVHLGRGSGKRKKVLQNNLQQKHDSVFSYEKIQSLKLDCLLFCVCVCFAYFHYPFTTYHFIFFFAGLRRRSFVEASALDYMLWAHISYLHHHRT
jgi:hypothetical protein